MMLIGEAAERSGVTADTLRYYERKGLIEAARRSAGGYRLFEEAVVARIEFIRKARGFGLSLREVGDVLRMSDEREAPCDHVRSVLAGRLQQLDERLAELRVLRDAVARALEPDGAAPLPAPSICRIIEMQEVERTGVWPRWQPDVRLRSGKEKGL